MGAGGGGFGAKHHQVVAIGYSMGRYKGDLKANIDDLEIFIYDPNYPEETVVMRPHSKAVRYRYVGKTDEWLTYFVDTKYQKETPGSQAVMERCSGIKAAGQNKSGQSLSSVQNKLVSFRCADLRKTKFRGATAMQVDFYKANVAGAVFYGANLRNSNFTRANAVGADFYGADVKVVQFTMADLTNARFYGADLEAANLDYANLKGANFQGADLSHASLKFARLVNATLKGTDLRAANLDGADLTGADVRGANFTGATITKTTKLADIKKDATTKGMMLPTP